MAERARNLVTSMSLISAMLIAGPVYGETKATGPDWYLVDEIIEDEAPDYRSDVFFADKASLKKENGYISISISQIIMSQVEVEGVPQSRIRDMRSRIAVDCNRHVYAALDVSEYNKDNKLVTSKTSSIETAEWILPFANSGYINIFRFACEPDTMFGTQEFPGDKQPLASILAYLNADWSN